MALSSGSRARRWSRWIVLFGLAAACSGRVEQRNGAGGLGSGGSFGVGGSGHTDGTGGVDGYGGSYGNGGGYGYGGSGCFVAGTRIATPAGATAIEALRIGDLVLAYDEGTARVVPRPVTATFVHEDHAVGALSTGDGRTLRVTANHPIYLPDQERYADAGELRADQRLLGLDGSARLTSWIGAGYVDVTGERATVYNITVAGEHNYFAEGVLVHNKSGAGPTGGCPLAGWQDACRVLPGCLDPSAPSPEYVATNQPRAVDAGAIDAGSSSDAAPDTVPPDATFFERVDDFDGGGGPVPIETGICGEQPRYPTPLYLAFDVWSSAAEPVVATYTTNNGTSCNGWQLGEAWLFEGPPAPLREWTTQCVRMTGTLYDTLTVVPTSADTYVENPRFVSGCGCARVMKHRTTCGLQEPVGIGCH